MRLLVFIANDDLPKDEVLLMIQRLHIDNYEEARPYLDEAVVRGIIQPRQPDGFFHQNQLKEVLRWAKERDV